jgi:hypothetical protein
MAVFDKSSAMSEPTRVTPGALMREAALSIIKVDLAYGGVEKVATSAISA